MVVRGDSGAASLSRKRLGESVERGDPTFWVSIIFPFS
jgi:hypothetical protein